jgi:hypothetical protein
MLNVNNNSTPVVIFTLIVMFFCLLFGVMVAADPFGPGQDARATQAIMNAQATEAAIHVMQTPQAIYAQQTVVVAELTAMPPIRTATAIAMERNFAAEQQKAIQTNTAGEMYLNSVRIAATASAVAESQRRQTVVTNTGTGLVILVIVTFCVFVLGRVTKNTFDAYIQHNLAQTKVLEQQRQLAELRLAHQKTGRPIVLPSVPISSPVKERGNGHKLPHAE